MALGQKRKVHHGALKYERETEYKVHEITISAKEHTSKNNLTPPQHRITTLWHVNGRLAKPRHSGTSQHLAKPGEGGDGVKTLARTHTKLTPNIATEITG